MALKAITFNNKNVTARDHGSLFNGILGDGAVKGCAVTYSGTTVTIASGYLLAHGRLIENTTALSVTLTDQSGYTRIKLVVDVDGTLSTATQNASTIAGLPALTQEDINDGSHETYEMELCILSLSNYAITGIAKDMPTATCPASVIGLDSTQKRHIYISASQPSGWVDGDIWLKTTT